MLIHKRKGTIVIKDLRDLPDVQAGPDLKLGNLMTTAVGSYAAPGWLIHLRESAASQGGPAHITPYYTSQEAFIGAYDLDEARKDATRIAIQDQQLAGLDEIGSGELYQEGSFIRRHFAGMGFHYQPPKRGLGPFALDKLARLAVTDRLQPNEHGLGVVEEWTFASRFADRPVKATLAGPLTLSTGLDLQGGYASYRELRLHLAEMVNQELKRLVAAGAVHVQLDEPTAGRADVDEFVELVQRALEGVKAVKSLHICFGNAAGRPLSWRRYEHLFPRVAKIPVDELVLEYASRGLDEIDLWPGWVEAAGRPLHLAAGVVDVKNSHVETPDQVAWRVERILRHVPPGLLSLTADCGFFHTSRALAFEKMRALVEGVAKVKGAGTHASPDGSVR